MSLATINQAANDRALQDRTTSGVWKETIANPTFGATAFGRQVLTGTAPITMTFSFPVAVDNEAAYASALAAGNPDPGGDPAVITDDAITAAIQAHWPADAEATP